MLENTKIFVKVVQQGSFSKAAAGLKMPKSTVSRAVRALEDQTGTTLMMRTTRNLALTAAGRAFYDTCVGPLQVLEEAQQSLHGKETLIAGPVKLTAPEDLGAFVISPALARLCRRHGKLNFEIHYTNEMVDLVKDGFDFAIRIGKLNPSRFKSKRIGVVTLILVASPSYLKHHPNIRYPADLKNFDALTLNLATIAPRWNLTSEKKKVTVPIVPRVISNQMTTLVRLAIDGAGIALVPQYLCQNALQRRELVHVLPTWQQNQFPVSIVSPLSLQNSARIKAVTDALAKEIGAALLPI